MLSPSARRALVWVGAGLALLLVLAWDDAASLHRVDSVHALHALPLPVRVEFPASIRSVRPSGAALIFDLENRGRISCYWRKPPAMHFFFPQDRVVVRAKMELTPRGKFCGVITLVPAAD